MSSPAVAAAEARRQRILAKGKDRLKYVNGEIKSLDEDTTTTRTSPVAAPPPAPFENEIVVEQAVLVEEKPNERMPLAKTLTSEAFPEPATNTPAMVETPKEHVKPRWEEKWLQDVSVVKEKKEISEETLKRLEVTQSLAVEAPRATGHTKTNVAVVEPTPSMFADVKLDSLLTTIVVIYLGTMSGITSGAFIDTNVWLPLGSFLLFALLLRVIISVSFRRLGLVKPARSTSSDSGGLISMALRFVPKPLAEMVQSFQMVSGYFKDSYDDMMLFVFSHGVASRLLVAQKS